MVFEDVVALAPVDVADERETLGKLKGLLEQLAIYQKSFEGEGKVCQAQVKHLVDECQIALDDRYPLASFTQAPSAVNLSAACEGVFRKAGDVIRELGHKAWELIKKMVAWLVAAFKNLIGRNRGVAQRVTVIAAVSAANEEVKSLDAVPSAGEAEAAEHKLADAIQVYKDYYSALAHAILTEDPFIGAVKAVSLLLPKQIGLITDKVALAEEVFRDVHRDRLMLAQQLATLGQPLPMGRLEEVARRVPSLQGGHTLGEFFQRFRDTVNVLHDQHPKGQMDWPIAVKTVLDHGAGFAEPLVGIPDEIEHAYHQLLVKVEAVGHGSPVAEGIDPSLAAQYNAAIDAITHDVQSMTQYAAAVNTVLDTQAMVADALYRCVVAKWELNRAKAQESGDPHVVEQMNAVQRKLRAAIVTR